eukprot:scpid109374/ scgid33392/ 
MQQHVTMAPVGSMGYHGCGDSLTVLSGARSKVKNVPRSAEGPRPLHHTVTQCGCQDGLRDAGDKLVLALRFQINWLRGTVGMKDVSSASSMPHLDRLTSNYLLLSYPGNF